MLSHLSHSVPRADHHTPPEAVLSVCGSSSNTDLHRDTLDRACKARQGMLQMPPEGRGGRGKECCVSWGPDLPAIRCARLQTGLLQPTEQYSKVAHCRSGYHGKMDSADAQALLKSAVLACMNFPILTKSMLTYVTIKECLCSRS